jgi:hypothetical protein
MKEVAPLGKPSYSDQKHQKQGNFPSFFFKVPFIYLFLNFLILWDAMMGDKTMLLKMSK